MRCQLSIVIAFLFAFLQLVVGSNVLVATDKTFDELVLKSGKTSLVKFYADWCSHCKRMAPAYEELADLYSKSDEIQIVEINGDTYNKITSRYGIQGFPTLMLFKKDKLREPVEFEGSRDVTGMENFLIAHTGVRVYKPKEVNHVSSVSDETFDKDVLQDDRAHFLVFTASWCGHCKNLKPEWSKLATVFSADSDTISIDEVLTTDVPADELKKRFEIKGFPTILYFPQGAKSEPEVYSGGRDLPSLVRFVNEKTGLQRETDGQLSASAGLIKNFDVSGLVSSQEKIKRAKEMLLSLETLTTPDAAYYKKLLNKILSEQEDFISKEATRLEKILSKSENLAQSKIDSIKKRLNVLKSFLKEQHIPVHDEF